MKKTAGDDRQARSQHDSSLSKGCMMYVDLGEMMIDTISVKNELWLI